MRIFLSLAFLLGTLGFVLADEPKEKPKADAPKKAAPEKETLKTQLEKIQKEQSESVQTVSKKLRELKDDDGEARQKLITEYMDGLGKNAQKVLDLAKKNLKDESAFEATVIAMQMGRQNNVSEEAAMLLVEHFADHPKTLSMVPMLGSMPDGEAILEKLGKKTTNKDMKATIAFTALESKVNNADYPRTGKPQPPALVAKAMADAKSQMASFVKAYGDLSKPSRANPNGTYADAVKNLEYFIDHLTIGKVAPEVECELLDGKKQKLSDLKGKVVVLDIWATWCGPCRAMIPHERKLVEKLKDKPFVLVSVSADAKKDTLTDFLEKEKMPWTHWWNGDKGGVVEKYQVRFYPTIYVLDAKGVIRFKHVRGDDMDKAVETLLKEMQKPAP